MKLSFRPLIIMIANLGIAFSAMAAPVDSHSHKGNQRSQNRGGSKTSISSQKGQKGFKFGAVAKHGHRNQKSHNNDVIRDRKVDETGIEKCVIDGDFDDRVAALKRTSQYLIYKNKCTVQFPKTKPLKDRNDIECVIPQVWLASKAIGVKYSLSQCIFDDETGHQDGHVERVQFLFNPVSDAKLNKDNFSKMSLDANKSEDRKILSYDVKKVNPDSGASGLGQLMKNGALAEFEDLMDGTNKEKFDCELYKSNLAFLTAIGEAPTDNMLDPRKLKEEGLRHNFKAPQKFKVEDPSHNMAVAISYLSFVNQELSQNKKSGFSALKPDLKYFNIATRYNQGLYTSTPVKKKLPSDKKLSSSYGGRVVQCTRDVDSMIKTIGYSKLVEPNTIVGFEDNNFAAYRSDEIASAPSMADQSGGSGVR